MPVVSVTRLKLRSNFYLPGFLLYAVLSMRQARRAPGFLGGQLASEPERAYWTVTLWTDEKAMKAFRDSGAHRRAMPRLMRWCSEASYTHWTQDPPRPPDLAEARQRLMAAPRFSKVSQPAPDQVAKKVVPVGESLRPGPPLRPRAEIVPT